MIRKVLIFSLLLLTIACGSQSNVDESQLFPEPTGFVNDFANKLDVPSKKFIEKRLRAANDEGTMQMSVVIVPTLHGYDVADYTVRLAKKWGVGKREKDNGIVFLIALKERKTRLEIGYGLEPKIPDSIAKRILIDTAKSYLKKDDFPGGINAVITEVMQRLQS
jgi:uncharacterized protein